MARRKTHAEPNDEALSFEEALSTLESIVEAMEHQHLNLEDLVVHYEKGSALLSRCESILQSARGRIELITLRNQNEIALEGVTKAADVLQTSDDSDDDDDDNDIRLF